MSHWIWGFVVFLAIAVPMWMTHNDKQVAARDKSQELAKQERKADFVTEHEACQANAITSGDKAALNNCYSVYDAFMKHVDTKGKK